MSISVRLDEHDLASVLDRPVSLVRNFMQDCRSEISDRCRANAEDYVSDLYDEWESHQDGIDQILEEGLHE